MNIGDFIRRVDSETGSMASICFLGFGISNKALFSALGECGHRQITIRSRSMPDEVPNGTRLYCGDEYCKDIFEKVLVLSPSVRRDTPEIADAVSRGSVLTSDAELYFADPPSDVYALTGSDGKSTTAYLAARLLGGTSAIGNFGIPFASAEDIKPPHAVELSSFMLSYISPRVKRALVTNITPNHLDWHKDFSEYRATKLKIYENAECSVLCADDPICAEAMRGKRLFAAYSMRKSESELRQAYCTEHTVTLAGECIRIDGSDALPRSAVLINEGYNLLNFMGALALTLGEADEERMRAVGANFCGLPHRCEVFLEYDGIRFIDSSIDTTPSRAAATINMLSHPYKILIGGKGKELDPSPLISALRRGAKKIALYGEEGKRLLSFFASDGELSRLPCELFCRFDSAVNYLFDEAECGDVMILCPAATSYGEFRDFNERGDRFKSIAYNYVNSLKYKK